MSEVFESLFSIIWLIIIFSVVKTAVGKSKTQKKVHSRPGSFSAPAKKPVSKPVRLDEDDEPEIPGMSRESAAPIMPHKPKAGEARPARAALRSTSALSDTITEDRQHDWLARQIREEKKRVVWNNFVDLGAAHDEACAAELNRMDHARRHQSYVVDDGVSDN